MDWKKDRMMPSMDRRSLLAAAAGISSGLLAGCTDDPAPPEPQIEYLELANHRHEGREFSARIEDSDGTAFETTERLRGDEPGEGAVVVDQPVSGPGAYEVVVEVDDYEASAIASDLTTEDEDCLYLEFYLGSSTLHFEYLTWPCDEDSVEQYAPAANV